MVMIQFLLIRLLALCSLTTSISARLLTTSPVIRMKSEVIICFASSSRITSPTERASGVTMGVIRTPEFGNDHRDALRPTVRTLGIMVQCCHSRYCFLYLLCMRTTKHKDLLYTRAHKTLQCPIKKRSVAERHQRLQEGPVYLDMRPWP